MQVMTLTVVQIDKDEANAYVERHHRHSLPVLQHKFSLGALAAGEFVGVAIVEWPKARKQSDGWTCEVTRVCTLGYPNACSFLYGACWRVVKGLGYLRVLTYTKDDEDGASCRAAGYVATGHVVGAEWDQPSRPRKPARYEISDRTRYEIRVSSWRPGLEPRPRIAKNPANPGQMELVA